jgi:hypothetical protein
VGFNTFGFAARAYGYEIGGKFSFGLDGGLLFIAVMTGVVGLNFYCAMLFAVLRRCRAVYRQVERTPDERGLALGVAAVTVAIVVHSTFLNSLLYPFLMEVLWVLWALVFLLQRQEAEEVRAGTEPRGSNGPLPQLVSFRST